MSGTHKKRIIYLGFYNDEKNYDDRSCPPAANAKMRYIISSLDCSNRELLVLSPCLTAGKNLCKSHEIVIDENKKVKYINSLPKWNKFFKFIDGLWMQIQILSCLKKMLCKEDIVIVYHSMWYMKMIKRLHSKIGFKLIYEVEEIYADMVSVREAKRITEIANLTCADAYVFPSKRLDSIVNVNKKNKVIIHGSYEIRDSSPRLFNDTQKHIIYAGSLDVKRGAETAVKAAGYLDNNYKVHISGPGSIGQQNKIAESIKLNYSENTAEVVFEGLKKEEDYINLLCSCDVGLCPQMPDAKCNASSFPSKILSYLSCGLKVVSARIPAIEESDVGDCLYYFDEYTPQAIAETIKYCVENEGINGKERLRELDQKFKAEINHLISNI